MNRFLLLLPLLLIISIPTAFAQVVDTQGENYDLIENFNIGEATWQSHPDRIMNGQWENYVLTNTNDKVIFNTNAVGSFIFDKDSCSYSIYENGYNGAQVIPSVSAVASYLSNGVWSNLPVNDQACTVEVREYNDGVFLTSTKVITETVSEDVFISYTGTDELFYGNGTNSAFTLQKHINGTNIGYFNGEVTITEGAIVESFVQELRLDINSGFKETFKVIHDGEEPLGISQTIHTGESITIGETTINIAELNGQSFDRQYIIDNEAEILQLTDSVNYDFDTGIDSLTNVNIIFDGDYKVNMDYANGDDGVPFVGYLEIDPTFSSSWATQQKLMTNGSTMDTNDCNISGNHYPSWNTGVESEMAYLSHEGNGNGVCAMPAYEFDISSIPDTNTIVDVVMVYDLITVGSESGSLTGFDWINSDEQIATTSGVDLQTQYLEMKGNTQYVQMGKTLGTNILADLGTTGDSDLQNSLSQDFFTTAIRLEPFDNHPTSSWQLIFENVELQVTYGIFTAPNAPTGLSTTIGIPLGTSWTSPLTSTSPTPTLDEDFTQFADDSAFDTSYVSQDHAKISGNSANDNIDATFVRDGSDDSMSYTLSSALDDTWILRYTYDMVSVGTGGNPQACVGLSSTNGNYNSGQDHVGLCHINTGGGVNAHFKINAGTGSWDANLGSDVTNTDAVTIQTNYIQITKSSPTAVNVCISSTDSFTCDRDNDDFTISSVGATLDKFRIVNNNSGSVGGNFVTTIDNVVIYNGMTSADAVTSGDGGSAITGYKVYRSDSAVAQTELPNSSGSDSELTFTDNEFLIHGFETPQYKVHSFTTTGTSTFQVTAGSGDVEYLVIGGGAGGGGAYHSPGGGGGGAGGFLTATGFGVTAQSYSIVVGAGGSGGIKDAQVSTSYVQAGSGGDSTFSTITSTGGGFGTTYGGSTAGTGGSGGGGSLTSGSGSGISGQGYAGGIGTSSAPHSQNGGGGGGSSGVGGDGLPANDVMSGVGGIGTSSSITGTATYYAGGGGAGQGYDWDTDNTAPRATGGSGVGGDGGLNTSGDLDGLDGTINSGSGGGGAGGIYVGDVIATGGDGGSGIVIVRYVDDGSITATGGTVTTAGGTPVLSDKSTNSVAVSASPTYTQLGIEDITGSYETGIQTPNAKGSKFTTGHVLIGTWVSSIDAKLHKTGSPTGNLELNVYSTDATDGNETCQIGVMDVSTLTGSYAEYTFDTTGCEISSADYVIALDCDSCTTSDWVNIQYGGGTEANAEYVEVSGASWTGNGMNDFASFSNIIYNDLVSPSVTSTTGSIGTALQNPNLSYADSNLPDNTDVLSVGGYVKLDPTAPTLQDDFSGADNWTELDSGVEVNTSTGVIDWESDGASPHASTYIAQSISDSAFILDFDITFDTVTSGSDTDGLYIAVLLDAENTYLSDGYFLRDALGVAFELDNSPSSTTNIQAFACDSLNIYDCFELNTPTGTVSTFTETGVAGETMNVRMVRDAGSFEVCVYPTASRTTATECETVDANDGGTVNGLQNIHVATTFDNTNDHTFDGTVDNIVLYDGITSIPEPTGKLLGLNGATFSVGTTTASVMIPTYTAIGNAWYFPNPDTSPTNDAGDGVTIGTASDWKFLSNDNNSWTISMWGLNNDGWVMASAFLGTHAGGNSGGSGSGGMVFEPRSSGSMRAYVNVGQVNYSFLTALSDTDWHHYVLTYDDSTSDMKLYLDNSLVGTNNGNISGSADPDHPLQLMATAFGEDLTGAMDDLAIWNVALDTSDVASLYAKANPNGIQTNDLKAYYDFEQTSGDLIDQSTGTASLNLDGTASGNINKSYTGIASAYSSTSVISATGLTDNTSTAQHYSFTRGASNDWTIYQNGVSQATNTDSTSLGSNIGTSQAFAPTPSHEGRLLSNGATGSVCGTGVAQFNLDTGGEMYVPSSSSADPCYRIWYEYDISSIPSGSTITDTTMTIDVSATNSPKTCDISPIVDSPSTVRSLAGNTAYSTSPDWDALWNSLSSATPYSSGDSWCQSTGSKTVDLGTTADSDITTDRSTGVEFVAFGVKSTGENSRDGSIHSTNTNASPTLTVTYSPPAPYTTNISGSLDEFFVNSDTLTSTEISGIADRGATLTPLTTTGASTTTYDDNTVAGGNTYYYSVRAENTIGLSDYVTPFVSGLAGSPAQPPTSVSTAINTPDSTPLEVTVSWSAPTNVGTGTLTGFEVYRDNVLIDTIGLVTSYPDTVPTGGGTFVYKLKSLATHGNSGFSSDSSITTATVPPTPNAPSMTITNPNPSPLDVDVSWTAQTSGGSAITSYEIFRSATETGTYSSVGTVTDLDFTDTVSTPGTWYYKIASTNLIGSSGQSTSSNITTATVPSSDSSATLAINNPNPNPLDITVSFVAPSSDGGSAVTAYNLYSSPDDSAYTQIASAVTADQTITVASPGTWYFKSEAANNVGTASQGSSVSIATPTVPTASSATLAINNPNPNPLDITATFVAPSSDGGSTVTSYNLYTSPNDITYTPVASAVTADQTITVANAGTWYFKSEAINNVGTGTLSAAVTIATPTVPSSDSSVTLAINNPNPDPLLITATFVAPSSDGGSSVTAYNLYYSDDDSTYSQVATAVTGSVDYTVTAAGTHYFQTQSINNVGTSATSSTVSIATPTVPDAPSVTLAINNPNPSPLIITSTFVAPSSDGGSSIINYNLYASVDDSTYISIVNATTGTFDYTVSGPGTHFFKSEVTNNVGTSALSSAFNFTTATVPVAITDLAASTVSDTAINLTWSVPNNGGSNIVDYTVFRDGVLVGTVTIAGFSDTGLTSQTSYAYTVYTRNNAGTSLVSNSVTQFTHGVPDQVSVFVATTASIEQLNLTWTPPNDYNSVITNYVLERESPTGNGFTPLITLTSETSYSDPGLNSVQEYNYRITAVNAYGSGPTNTASAITLPAEPTGIVVTPNSSSSELIVTWNTPALTSGITGYQILREDGVGTGFTPITVATGTTFTDTGLTDNIYYNYKLRAVASQGYSGYSNTYSQTTFHLPMGVQSLTATSGDLIDAGLSWSSPTVPYGYITGYEIFQSTTGTPNVLIDSTTGTSYTATDLDPTITYYWLVAPVTIHGTNSTGNIANATATSEIVIGDIIVSKDVNPVQVPINFKQIPNGNSTDLTVTYATGTNLSCEFDHKFARTNYTHGSLAETFVSTTKSSHTFTFNNSANEIISVHCYDQDTNPGGDTIVNDQTDGRDQINFAAQPIVTQVNDFQKGAFGISSGFGAFDLMTLFVVLISMVGFNRKNPAVGIGIMVSFIGAMGYFGIIEPPTIVMGILAVVVVVSIGQVRKNR